MMYKKGFLSLCKLPNPDHMLCINSHPSDGFSVCDIGDHQLTVVFKRDEAAIKKMID